MILKDLPVNESCINGKMTKNTRAKKCLELVHIDMLELLVSIYGEGMGILTLLVMITLGLDMYIGNLKPWIHSLNLR